MRIGVFGVGYVGLVTSACFAELGHSVVAVDKDTEIVGRLSDGVPTLHEPGLQQLLTANLRSGRLAFTTSAADAVEASDILFLCVGTPSQDDGRADLSQVDEAVRSIAPLLQGYKLIVEKSTVPVNTAVRIDRAVREWTLPNGASQHEIASNPEFLRQGSAVQDFMQPYRIVVGADSERARTILLDLYQRHFHCPILVTDVKTAELIKYAANAFLAAKISFINMMSDLCDEVGADVSVIANGVGLDPRIGPHFLNAGLGYGGSCFSKDLKALVWSAKEHGVDFSLLEEVERINESRVDRLLGKLAEALEGARGNTVGVLGVAFKANTDDVRSAPSLKVMQRLRDMDVVLRVYDPYATAKMARVWPADGRLCYVESAYQAAEHADALLILTDWEEFRSLDLARLRASMRVPVIVDGRNLFDRATLRESGFGYFSLGRGDLALSLGRLPKA